VPALYLIVALGVFVPRVFDLGGFLTVDEANFWLARSSAFLDAVRRGDWAATAISTHPGVTTMWLGSIGLLLREWFVEPGVLPGDFVTALALMRLPAALIHSLAVVLGYALLRRLLTPIAALLAALLWAADPFVVAYSRLLHVDALAGTFMTLSVLAALVAGAKNQEPRTRNQEPGTRNQEPRTKNQAASLVCGLWSVVGSWWWLVSGVFGGLALLSKSPSLVLVPVIGVIALSAARPRAAGFSVQRSAFSVQLLAIWCLAAALTFFALWPALWVDPLGALGWLRTGVEAEGAQPHMLGNFFLGRADDAPGLLFYPVALALRLTPITLLGVLLLPLWLRRLDREQLRALALVALFVLLLAAGLSVFPKKFNRYIVPAFPALDILAAAGLTGALNWIASLRAGRFWPRRVPALGMAALVVLASANLAFWHPYPITAFNQVLGGAPAGARTFAIGWGEGFEQVAAWLNQQPDITGVSVVSRIPVVQAPYMRPGTHARTPQQGNLPADTGYIVVYVSQVQRGLPSPPFDRFFAGGTPLHTVRIQGVDYAWIYAVPPPLEEVRPAAFGDAIRLRGFDWITAPQAGSPAVLRLQWELARPIERDYVLFAHLVGADGERVAQVDLPLPTSSWQVGRYQQTELPITMPATAAGELHVLVGLYDPATLERLPLTTALPREPALSGADALPLTVVRLP
jgi:4-amino-4-deoxy-L-arabinose transferase-like glycosyltransferase